MVIKSAFRKRFFRSVGPEVSQEFVIFIPELDIIGYLIFALNLDKKYKIIMNQ